MVIKLPDYVQLAINILEENGYQAYLVGGAIRDILLNKVPIDYDIGTNALPDEIEKLFSDFRTINVGKKFGTIILSQKEGDVEITTFRKEGGYIDGRRPEWVNFSSNIIDDLGRRDITINAMAYNNKKGIIDPFGGTNDLEKKVIKTVGDAEERFREDYLRILRVIRFSTQLGFTIEESTLNAGKKYSSNILEVSKERIADELFKILLSETPSNGIKLLEKMEILNVILPELIYTIGFDQKNPHHEKELYQHILCVLDNTPPILSLRLAALFHDIGKPHTQIIDEKGIGHYYGHDKVGAKMTKDILKRFNASNELIKKTTVLVREHMNHHNKFSEKGLKRLIRRIGEDEIFNLLILQKADIKCSNKDANINHIIGREKKIKKILDNNEAFDIQQLNIDGHELIELGFKEGKIIGDTLEYLLEKIMEDPELNKKEILKEMAKKTKS